MQINNYRDKKDKLFFTVEFQPVNGNRITAFGKHRGNHSLG